MSNHRQALLENLERQRQVLDRQIAKLRAQLGGDSVVLTDTIECTNQAAWKCNNCGAAWVSPSKVPCKNCQTNAKPLEPSHESELEDRTGRQG